MTFDQFVDLLHAAGWRSTLDAQHDGARWLFGQLCGRMPAGDKTLRDDFAGQALAAIDVPLSVLHDATHMQRVASHSYLQADHMLAARDAK